ncbi:MAG: outer membrane protein transport protein [Nitrospirae bacterium]|nr:outer membrane protein transport protein [Nitrospirota bacterium]
MKARKSYHGFIVIILMVFIVILESSTAFPITNTDEWRFTDFNFAPPGARASGMGGAFVGLADDATAAVTNPAGLAQLPRTQVAVEGNYKYYDKQRDSKVWNSWWNSNGNNVPGDGHVTYQDTKIETNTKFSFAAVSTPLFDKAVTVSIFYNKVANSNTNGNYSRHDSYSNFDQPTHNEVSIDEYGLSVAKGFLDDKLFLGVGVSAVYLDLKSEYMIDSAHDDTMTSAGSSTKLAYRAGVLFLPWDFISFGMNFNRMPKFDYTSAYPYYFTSSGNPYAGMATFGESYKIPDNFSIGAAIKPLKNWTIVTEGKYVFYSDLMEDFKPALYINQNPNDLNPSNYSIKDVWEFHLGTEYVFMLQDTPLAVRAGTYFDPKHALYANSQTNYNGLDKGGESLWHYTVGLGTVLANHWQIDTAADIAKDRGKVTLSMVYQF